MVLPTAHAQNGPVAVRILLGVTDKERGDPVAVHDPEELVDVRVEDGLADQTQGAVSDSHCFSEALCSHSGDALHHLDLLVVRCCDAVEDHVWSISDPSPCRPDGICAVSPAEDTLVGA